MAQLPGCSSVTVAAAVVPHHHAAVLLLLLLFEGLLYFGSLQAAVPANTHQNRVTTKKDFTTHRLNQICFFTTGDRPAPPGGRWLTSPCWQTGLRLHHPAIFVRKSGRISRCPGLTGAHMLCTRSDSDHTPSGASPAGTRRCRRGPSWSSSSVGSWPCCTWSCSKRHLQTLGRTGGTFRHDRELKGEKKSERSWRLNEVRRLPWWRLGKSWLRFRSFPS